MARKKKERVQRAIQIKRSEVKNFFAEQTRLKTHQSEYSGTARQATRLFKERTGLSPAALAFIGKLGRLGDDIKRQSVMDEVIMLFNVMGWNDQGRLFDRVQAKMEKDLADDDEDNEAGSAPVEGLKQDGLPLDVAKEIFDAANEVAEAKAAVRKKRAAADALSDLAGDNANTTH